MKVHQVSKLVLFFFITTFSLSGQTVIPELGELFRDDVVARVDIIMPSDSVEMLLAPGNEYSNYHYHATFVFNNGTVNDTIENVGFRLRGNTSRGSEKKSFKISFNTYESGRKYDGIEKMNLNGEHNDPSITRSKIGWDILRDMKLAGSRANHVELYINNDYYGLYINTEHIDEEYVELRFGNKNGNLYKCLWPADLDYKGDNPDVYKAESGGRRTYDLRTNTELDDYSDLAHFIDILNNTSADNLPCALEPIFHVDDYLKYLAMDIFMGNWDGAIYNKNNFYLYHNTATDKFEYIPYDLDNTLGIDWFDIDWATRNIYDWGKHNEPRPLYWSIMAVQEYRDRFSYYMDNFEETILSEDHLFSNLDEIKNQINASVSIDPYSPLDYGFSHQDFLNSFDQALEGSHVSYGLKPYILARNEAIVDQLEVNNIRPIIRYLQNNTLNQGQDINIRAQIIDDEVLAETKICYSINNENPTTCLPIFDNGLHNDGLAGDGIYGVIIPAIEGATSFHYYIDATDESDLRSRLPRCSRQEIIIETNTFQLYINELMASNDTAISDEAGEFDDWLELYYNGAEPLYLGDKYLSDNETVPNKWLMPDMFINPGEYLLFWADEDQDQGPMHTNFKLSAGGEFIGVFDTEANDFALIDGYTFGEQETDVAVGRIPDGTGVFQAVVATPAGTNQPLTAVINPSQTIVGRVYPNPFHDYFTVECPSHISKTWTAKLMNPLGQVLLTQKMENGLNTISVKELSLPSGGYFLKIMDESGNAQVIRMLLIE